MDLRWSPLLLLLAAACGADGPAEPRKPPPVTVNGVWQFTWQAMNDGSRVCQITLSFDLIQNGTSFTGYQRDPTRLRCVASGVQVVDAEVSSETIINGAVVDGQVSFRLGSIAGSHSGTLTGDMMHGVAAWQAGSSASPVVFTGPWIAARR